MHSTDGPKPVSVGWVFPTGVTGWMRRTGIALGYDIGSAEQHPSLRDELDAYLAAARALPDTTPVAAKSLAAVTVDPSAESALIAVIEELIAELVSATAA